MLTFASLFFAAQFFTKRYLIVSTTALMAVLSIGGSHNRLRLALKSRPGSDKNSRNIIKNHLLFCLSMADVIAAILYILSSR